MIAGDAGGWVTGVSAADGRRYNRTWGDRGNLGAAADLLRERGGVISVGNRAALEFGRPRDRHANHLKGTMMTLRRTLLLAVVAAASAGAAGRRGSMRFWRWLWLGQRGVGRWSSLWGAVAECAALRGVPAGVLQRARAADLWLQPVCLSAGRDDAGGGDERAIVDRESIFPRIERDGGRRGGEGAGASALGPDNGGAGGEAADDCESFCGAVGAVAGDALSRKRCLHVASNLKLH